MSPRQRNLTAAMLEYLEYLKATPGLDPYRRLNITMQVLIVAERKNLTVGFRQVAQALNCLRKQGLIEVVEVTIRAWSTSRRFVHWRVRGSHVA